MKRVVDAIEGPVRPALGFFKVAPTYRQDERVVDLVVDRSIDRVDQRALGEIRTEIYGDRGFGTDACDDLDVEHNLDRRLVVDVGCGVVDPYRHDLGDADTDTLAEQFEVVRQDPATKFEDSDRLTGAIPGRKVVELGQIGREKAAMGRGILGQLEAGRRLPLATPDDLAVVEPVDSGHHPVEFRRHMERAGAAAVLALLVSIAEQLTS